MLDILRAELYALRFGKTLPGLCAVTLFLAGLSAFVTRITQGTPDAAEIVVNGQLAAYQAPVSSTYMLFFLAILAAEIVVGEYSKGTIKNLVASGKRRWQLYMAKLIVLVLCAAALTAFCVVIYSGIYTLVFGWGGQWQLADVAPILAFYGHACLLAIVLVSIAMLAAIIFRSPVATISVCAGLVVGEVIIAKLLAAIPALQDAINYLPAALFSAIARPEVAVADSIRLCVVVAGVSVAATAVGLTVFKRQDIK